MDTKKWCKPSELCCKSRHCFACKRSGIRQIVLNSPEFLIYWYQWHDCKWFKPMVNSQVREKETSWQNLSGANAIKRRPHVPAKFTKQAHRRKQFGSCRWGARLRVESGGKLRESNAILHSLPVFFFHHAVRGLMEELKICLKGYVLKICFCSPSFTRNNL